MLHNFSKGLHHVIDIEQRLRENSDKVAFMCIPLSGSIAGLVGIDLADSTLASIVIFVLNTIGMKLYVNGSHIHT